MASTIPRYGAKPAEQEHNGYRRCLLNGVPIDCVTMQQAAARAVTALQAEKHSATFLIMGPNAQLVGLAQKNVAFAKALQASNLNIPDGISVVLASRLTGETLAERVTGGELMERLCRESTTLGFSVFFLGGLPEAAVLAARNLAKRYPGLKIAGTYCPPHGFENDPQESEVIFAHLAATQPDLLCVAFGAPKQEVWMHRNRHRLQAKVAMSIGAALDTQAGLRKRAPLWTRKIGVEWIYRMMAEPKRLWRRYLIGNSYFIYLVAKQLLFDRQRPS